MAAAKANPAEAEPDNEPEGAEEAGKSTARFSLKLSRKMMIIVGAGLLVVVGAGAGGWFYFGRGDKHEKVEARSATFVDIPEVLVNLSNAGSDRTQYLKVKITLEIPDKDAVPII
jgi:flagellar FliL protein